MSPSPKSIRTRLLFIPALTAGVMLAFEVAKQYLKPHFSPWESHLVTIVFVTALAGFVTVFVVVPLAASFRDSTEKLREKHAALSALVDAAPYPAFLVDASFRVLLANSALAKVLRRSVDDLVGTNLFDALPEREVAEKRVELMREVLRTKQTMTFTDARAGRTYVNHLVPALGGNGAVSQIAVIALDLTDIFESERRRREAHERLQNITARIPGFVFEMHVTLEDEVTFRYASDGVTDVVGLSASALMADFSSLAPIIHPDDLPRLRVLRHAAVRDLRPQSYHFRCIVDGSIRYILIAAAPHRLPDGSTVFHGYAQDGTRQVRAEAALRAVMQGTAGHTGKGFFVVLAEWLATALDVHGVLVAELVQRDEPERRALVTLARWPSIPDAERIELPAELAIDDVAALATFLGERLGVGNVRLSPIVSVEGAMVGLVAVFDDRPPRDVDLVGSLLAVSSVRAGAELERRAAQLEIEAINADLERRVHERTLELEAAIKELETFSYSVSHDLRAPLRSIDGFSLALLEDYGSKLDDDGRKYLGIVRGESQRLGVLIDDLLRLSRVSRGPLRRTTVDLGALAAAAIARLRMREPHRKVECEIAPALIVEGDAGLLQVLVDNLVENAWKFTSRVPAAHLAIGSEMVDGEQSVYVRDDGAGFDMAYADKLFAPFQRLHRSTEFEGHGVGLATVHRVVTRHGGRIWAEGRVGGGATFRFTLRERA